MITKADMGLSNVDNFATATEDESIDSENNITFITPTTLAYVLSKKIVNATNDQLGILLLNNGIFTEDDVDSLKAMTANGIVNLINNTGEVFNNVQTALLKLSKEVHYKVNTVGGNADDIILDITPNTQTNELVGLLQFKALYTNTAVTACTINTGIVTLPVKLWNGQSPSSGMILMGNTYTVMPFKDKLILLNPESLSVGFNNSTTDERLTEILESENPFTMYQTETDVEAIVTNGFKGSYIGTTDSYTNNTYNITIPTSVLQLGMFSVTFNKPNITAGSSLNVNGTVKPMCYFNGTSIGNLEFNDNDTRIVINTPNSYLVFAFHTTIQDQALIAITNHLKASDPHKQYWNDIRGISNITAALNEFQLTNLIPATEVSDGFMSANDKVKLDLISGTNTGDETAKSIVQKLSGYVIDVGTL